MASQSCHEGDAITVVRCQFCCIYKAQTSYVKFHKEKSLDSGERMITRNWRRKMARIQLSLAARSRVSRLLRGHPMRRLLEAYLKKEITGADLTIHYYIAGGLGGETNFRLHGDGRYELYSNVTSDHQRKRYAGQVPVSQVEKVAQKMLATKIWQVWHDHESRGLDESGAKIVTTAGSANGTRGEVMLWVSEIRESPAFVRVQRQLLSLIHQISQGEVLEKGRGTFHLFPEMEERQTPTKSATLPHGVKTLG